MNAVAPSDLAHKIAKHGAPTLAGIKPANLFMYHHDARRGCEGKTMSPRELERGLISELGACKSQIAPWGVDLKLLGRRRDGVLVYVYRRSLIERDFADARVASFLKGEGYDPTDLDFCLKLLRRRINATEHARGGACAFPHEIGLFLGYPLDDVLGFIENKGENYLCSGCWKVYSHQRDAQECFCRYKDCAATYEYLFTQGVSLGHLASFRPQLGRTRLRRAG